MFPADCDFSAFNRAKSELAADWSAVRDRLGQNTARVAAVIRATANADLSVEVAMPWGPMTLSQLAAYPYWNMTYHEGQINYIASMLGCLT